MTTPKQSAFFMLAWMLTQVILAFLLPTLDKALWYNGIELSYEAYLLISQLAGNLLPVLFAMAYARRRGRQAVIMRKPDAISVFYAFLMGIFIQPLGMVVSSLSSIFDNTAMNTIQSVSGRNSLLISIALMAVLPAITEELACRGVPLNGYAESSRIKSALLNGLLFGLMHMNLRQFFYAFFLGAIITMVVLRSGSALYGIVMHLTINASQLLMLSWASGVAAPAPGAAEATDSPLSGVYPILLVTALIIGSTYLLYIIYKRFRGRSRQLYPDLAVEPRGKVMSWPVVIYIIIGGLFTLSEFISMLF